MSRISLLSCTALVAASLAIAAPQVVLSQDVPVITQDQGLIWTRVERFGILVPIPEGAPVTDDVDTPADRSYAVNTTEGSAPGVRVGIKVLTPADLAELPVAPGAEGFAGFLSRIGGLDVQPTGVVVQLGARALHAYGGSGTRTAPDGVQVEARVLFLVAHDVDAEGQGLLLAFYAQGLDAEAAGQAEAEFASRLAVAPAAPVEADPAATEPAPAEPVTADPPPPETPATAEVTDPPQGPAPVTLIDGLATLTLTAEDVIVRTERDEDGVDLRLTNDQGQLLRVMAAPPDAAMVDRLRRVVGPRGSVDQGEAGGQPVWIVRGVTNRPPIGRRSNGIFPITVVVPQYCLVGGESMAVAVISEEGAGVEALLQGLTFTRPEGAQMCAALATLPDVVTDPRAEATDVPPPGPTEPAIAEAPPSTPAAPDTAPDAAPETVAMLGDLVLLSVGDGREVLEVQGNDEMSEVLLAAATGDMVWVRATLLSMPLAAHVNQLLQGIDAVEARVLSGQPVWVVYGPSRQTVFVDDVSADPASPGRLVIPQVCVGGQPPYLIELVAEPWNQPLLEVMIDSLAPGRPAGAEACPDAIGALPAVAAGPATPPANAPAGDGKVPALAQAPQPQPQPPLTSHPLPMADLPEPLAWAAAREAGTEAAVRAYLDRWPRGLNSGEARAWLAANGAAAAGSATPQPPPAPILPMPSADDLAWQAALSRGTAGAFWTYLKAQPQGAHVAEAQARLASRPTPEAPATPPAPGLPYPIQPAK